MMNTIQTALIALIIGALLAGVAVWVMRGKEIDLIKANHNAAIAEAKLETERANNQLNQFKLDFETKLGDAKDDLQNKYTNALGRIDKSLSDLSGRRLQDPHANSGTGTTGNSTGAGGGDGTGAGGGVLSEEASEFLYSFTGDAERILERLRVCQAWNTAIEDSFRAYSNDVNALRDDLRERGILKED